MIGLSDCQRTKCGAKNFFRTPIYPLLQNYFFASVEDQFKVWPNDTNNEIFQYLGQGLRYPDCASDIFGNCFFQMCGISEDGGLITEGTIEEDYYNPVIGDCNFNGTSFIGWHHHFYDPDNGGKGLCDNLGALDYALVY